MACPDARGSTVRSSRTFAASARRTPNSNASDRAPLARLWEGSVAARLPLAPALTGIGAITRPAGDFDGNSARRPPYRLGMIATARRWIAGGVALLVGAAPAFACTTFVLRDGGMVL